MKIPQSNLIFAIKFYLAIVLAYFISSSLELGTPFIAPITVAAIMSPFTGMTMTKSLSRFVAMFVAGMVVLILFYNFSSSPEMLLTGMILVSCLGGYLGNIDGTPRGFLFTMCGYSVPMLGITLIQNPTGLFDVVLYRILETLVGIFAAYLIDRIFLPRKVSNQLSQEIQAWKNQVEKWLHTTEQVDVVKLTEDAINFRYNSTHTRFDHDMSLGVNTRIQSMQWKMLEIIPAIQELKESPSLEKQKRIEHLLSEIQDPSNLINLQISATKTAPLVHRDYKVALLFTINALISTTCAAFFWQITSWSAGAMMVGFSAISASFFGSSDNASPKLKKALLITILCPIIAGLYMFGLHPFLRHPEIVMLSLGIPLLPVGLLISFNPAGVLVAFMIIANLSWQNFSSANNFNAYIEAASAISLGFLTTFLVTLVFNRVSTRYFLRRLILACRRDLRLAKNGQSRLSKEDFLSVMLHRMTLIGTRVPEQKRQASTKAILRNINLGLRSLSERKT